MGQMLEYLYSRPWMMKRDLAEIAEAYLMEREEGVGAGMVDRRPGMEYDRAEAEMTVRESSGNRTAIIPVIGPIFRYSSFFTKMCGGATVEGMAHDLASALDDDGIDSILMDINSGGGEASGIGEFAGMIREGTERKPIIGYISDSGASAAYYIASATSTLVMAKMASAGAIGVIRMYPRKSESKTRAEIVSSQSPRKRVDIDTDEGLAVIQEHVNDVADVFISDVASFRGVTPEKVMEEFGRGGMLVGAKAVKAGMADKLGSFEGILSELATGRHRRKSIVTVGPATPNGEHEMPQGTTGAAGGAASQGTQANQTPTEHIPAPPGVTAAEAAEMRAEMAQLRADRLKDRNDRVKAEAMTFVATHRNRIPPGEQAEAREAYAQASLDDIDHPLSAGTRVAKIEAQVAKRPVHHLLDPNGAGSHYAPAGSHLLDTGDDAGVAATGPVEQDEFRQVNGQMNVPARKSVDDLIAHDPELLALAAKSKAIANGTASR